VAKLTKRLFGSCSCPIRFAVALSFAGRDGEALIVVGAEAGEDSVGGVEIASLSEAEFADQAVLAGAPGALDAALGWGRVGGDLLDAEFFQSATQMGGALLSGELFGESQVGIITLKDAVAITVQAKGDARRVDHGAQSAKIAESVFGFELKVRREDLAGGVILKADEGELRAAALGPIVTAGVGEHHHAEARGGAGGASAEKPAWPRAGCGEPSRD